MDHRDPNTYRFDDFIAGMGENWYAQDPILQRWLARSELDDAQMAMVDRFGRRVATRYREIADHVERVENLPAIAQKGAYNRDRQEIVLPPETRQVLGEVHGSGIWKEATDDRARYAIMYLLSQNGEAGVLCSAACTDGMIRVLRMHGDDRRSRQVIAMLEEATPERWIHGAQFVTEIQGGSDAVTNQVAAAQADDGLFELSGQKWFCSNLTADYWMVTARLPGGPDNHRGIGLFCVPRLWEGAPNGHRIERLKDKLGTRALPTAELRLERARGWPVGALDAGLKNMVAVVLTTSRVYNVIAAAAGVRSAVRQADAYARFRRAFGRTLIEQPLVAASLEELRADADRLEAGALQLVDEWASVAVDPGDRAKALWVRVLVSLAKATATREASGPTYRAMMVLGGNGIEERFCSLPRLWRDAAIMETWEGPYTLLLMQSLGDLAKYGVAGTEEAVLRGGLGDFVTDEQIGAMAEILKAPEVDENVRAWGRLAPTLYRAFEERALSGLAT